ncbi:hypothetical protein E2I00_002806 [Balaenoptera physalus]|uniref:Progestin and adipoQ receptor family member 6 n=1 Tax=Balaenoptera physalus TaxID=9770 RepID=A0A643BQP7_BALPH|nr:hypothetical protein E2I00_002806 [Balaenoptera physalus]
MDKAGIVLWLPFVSHSPPRPGPPARHCLLPPIGPAGKRQGLHPSTWRCRATMLSLKLPQLLRVHQVPRVFWEDGIMSGYRRPTSSALDCVLSSFQMTNETVNIWTHFLPTWFGPRAQGGTQADWDRPGPRAALGVAGGPPYHWPLLVFLLPACLYPFASCCAHTFSSIGWHQDALITSVRADLAWPRTGWGDGSPEHRGGSRPRGCGAHHGSQDELEQPWGWGMCPQPPILPTGHSHQLFHICAVMGTHFQLEAVLADMGSRRAWLAMQEPPLGLAGTVATLGLAGSRGQAPPPRAGEEPRPRPDQMGALLSLEPRGVAEERVRRSEGRGAERGWGAGREQEGQGGCS